MQVFKCKTILQEILWCIGYLLSFIYTKTIDHIFKWIWNCIYKGWITKQFADLKGNITITGKIILVGGKYITIGSGTIIQKDVNLLAWDHYKHQKFSPKIIIGKSCVLQKDVFISAINEIKIGDNVAISQRTIILDNVHGDFNGSHLTFNDNPDVPDVFLQNVFTRNLASKGRVIIENDVHIGMDCVIMPSVTIGHNSVINAHTIVSKNVPPYSIVSGNPGKIIMTFGE